jgi:hypothetical protein
MTTFGKVESSEVVKFETARLKNSISGGACYVLQTFEKLSLSYHL